MIAEKKIDIGRKSRRTLSRIAVQLGHLPRFAGDLRVPNWTVLHHLVTCWFIADIKYQNHKKAFRDSVCFYALTHDIHEVNTGDIPTFAKTDDMRLRQAEWDVLIYGSFGTTPPVGKVAEAVKWVDLCAMECEGEAVGPPDWETHYPGLWDCGGKTEEERKEKRDELHETCKRQVQSVYDTWPSPHHSNTACSDLVLEWLKLVDEHVRIGV